MTITFVKADITHKEHVFAWLQESHVQEFWDNSHEHKEDILNFMNGRITPSNYCEGLYSYWIGLIDMVPFSMIMTLQEKRSYDIPQLKKDYLSVTGTTYSVDYMIGNKDYLGKNLGAKTLEQFMIFFRAECDSNADTFLIDPDVTNPRARHVYEKAGFKYVGTFIMDGCGVFTGRQTSLLVKKF